MLILNSLAPHTDPITISAIPSTWPSQSIDVKHYSCNENLVLNLVKHDVYMVMVDIEFEFVFDYELYRNNYL